MAYISSIQFACSERAIEEGGLPGALEDIRKGSGGKYIYPVIKTTNDAGQAIKGFAFTQDGEAGPSGFNKIDQDLNKGGGGKYNFLWTTCSGGHAVTAVKFELRDSDLASSLFYDGWNVFPHDLIDTSGAKFCYLLYKCEGQQDLKGSGYANNVPDVPVAMSSLIDKVGDCRKGEEAELQRMIDARADLNAIYWVPDESTALSLACGEGMSRAVLVLVEAKADVNKEATIMEGAKRGTPLEAAMGMKGKGEKGKGKGYQISGDYDECIAIVATACGKGRTVKVKKGGDFSGAGAGKGSGKGEPSGPEVEAIEIYKECGGKVFAETDATDWKKSLEIAKTNQELALSQRDAAKLAFDNANVQLDLAEDLLQLAEKDFAENQIKPL